MSNDTPGDRVRTALAGTRFADVRWVRETGSTNADVLELARQGAPEGIVVVADHQTAGRGRNGRTWEAPTGASLMCSALLRPPAAVGGLSTMVMAVAASRAVESSTGVRTGLKWPNDLVWPGDGSSADRKLAGILAEADWPAGSDIAGGWRAPSATQRVVVVVGIGLNVGWAGRMPAELAEVAVSLDDLLGDPAPDREDLLAGLLRELDGLYGSLLADGSVRGDGVASVLDEWRRRSATLGRRVRVDLGNEDVVGTAVDLTDEGHLVVETLEGGRRVLAVGDVVHLRPLGTEGGPGHAGIVQP